LSAGVPAKAAGYALLYSFGKNGKSGDGIRPVAKLLPFDGALYGTAQYGGIGKPGCFLGCGIVFRVSTSGVEEIVYRFKGGADGLEPTSDLTALNGALFGTTSKGGTGPCSGGCGTVFRLVPGKSKSVIYAFKGRNDGATPWAGVVAFAGTLYGTTEYGGLYARGCFSGCGTVFQVSPRERTERVVHRFKGGRDGAMPLAGLTLLHGAFFGTTEYGGLTTAFCSIGCGTVFRVDPDGAKRVLHAFAYKRGSHEGAYPVGDLIPVHDVLYGTTYAGGTTAAGTVFRVTPRSGSERILYTFRCCPKKDDGAHPLARLLDLAGRLYGTTRDGGERGFGTVFEITTGGHETVLYSFEGKPDGAIPQAQLTSVRSVLYGTTASGGKNDEGTVFRLFP
jgi:uncharacterized repeat protein (TIGR03803 family)